MEVTTIRNALYDQLELSYKMFQSNPSCVKDQIQIIHVQGELDIRKDTSDQVIKAKGKQCDSEDTNPVEHPYPERSNTTWPRRIGLKYKEALDEEARVGGGQGRAVLKGCQFSQVMS